MPNPHPTPTTHSIPTTPTSTTYPSYSSFFGRVRYVFILFFLLCSVLFSFQEISVAERVDREARECAQNPDLPSCRTFNALPERERKSRIDDDRKSRAVEQPIQAARDACEKNADGSSIPNKRYYPNGVCGFTQEYCSSQGAHLSVGSNGNCEDRTWCGPQGISLQSCLITLVNFIARLFISAINWVLHFILYYTLWFLDLVVYLTVVKFTSNFVNLNVATIGNTDIGSGLFGENRGDLIYYIWSMIRDFVNLLLLITILYYAVKTMFDGFSDHRNKFIYLLVFSIVINFSLFFVKFAIDVSNILMLQAYTLMAEPTGFETWEQFRGSGRPGINSTISEYLLNVAEVSKVYKRDIAEKQATDAIRGDLANNAVYHLGIFIILVCLIYMAFWLIGFLVMRAAAFIFAMLVAALLAADIFFNTFTGQGKDGKDYEFAASIKKFTDNIRDDFFEALVRGPILFLFLFLSGVLANAVINQALISEITNASSNGQIFKLMGNDTGTFISTFVKFATFFALTYVLFNKLKELKIGSGGHWVGTGATKLANFAMRNTVGRGVGAGSYMARRVVGQGLAGGATGKWLGNKFTAMQESKSTFGRLVGNTIGQYGNRSLNRIKASTFDPRASKRLQTLGSKISTATGANIDFGPAAEGDYKKVNQKALDDAKARREEYIKDAQSGVTLNSDESKQVEKDTKISFVGGRYTTAELEKIKKDVSTGTADSKGMVEVDFGGGRKVSFNKKSITEFDTSKGENMSQVDAAILLSKKAVSEAKKEAEQKKKDEVKGRIDAQIARGEGPTFIKETLDHRLTEAVMGRDIDASLKKEYSTTAATELEVEMKKNGKKYSILMDTKADLEDAYKQVDSAIKVLPDDATISAMPDSTDVERAEKERVVNLKKTLKDKKEEIETVLDTTILSEVKRGATSDVQVAAVLKFADDSDLHNQLSNLKGDVSEALISVYDRSRTASGKAAADTKFKALEAAKEKAEIELEEFNKGKAPRVGSRGYRPHLDRKEELRKNVREATSQLESFKTGLEKAQKLQKKAEEFADKLEKNFGHAKEEVKK